MIRRGRSALRLPSTRPPMRRVFWILGQLRAGRPLKATDIARTFEIGLRTAYRDMDFIRDFFALSIDYDRTAGTYRLTSPTAALPPVLLSEGELVALFFAEKVLRQYKGTPYEKDVASAFRKIETLLPDEVKVLPDRLESLLSLDLGPLPAADPEVFKAVVTGLARRRCLVLRYKSNSSGRTLDRTVEPQRVFNLRGQWYLAAYDHNRKATRDFALHRIRRATVSTQPVPPERRFDFRAYMADALGIEKGGRVANVAIRFTERQARWIRERLWHRTQRIQERLDGGCVLRMRLAVTGELLRWVMQFGAEAEVLAPRSFRNAVGRELRAAGKAYAPASSALPQMRAGEGLQ